MFKIKLNRSQTIIRRKRDDDLFINQMFMFKHGYASVTFQVRETVITRIREEENPWLISKTI